MQEPILQKTTVRSVRRADLAFLYQPARFLAERVVAQVVGDAADAIRFARELYKHFGFARIHGQRLFAQDMFSCAEQFAGLLEVNVIGRADMDGGDS